MSKFLEKLISVRRQTIRTIVCLTVRGASARPSGLLCVSIVLHLLPSRHCCSEPYAHAAFDWGWFRGTVFFGSNDCLEYGAVIQENEAN